MKNTSQLHRVLWLANTLFAHPHCNQSQIENWWQSSSVNCDKQSRYIRRKLLRDRAEIMRVFGIDVACQLGRSRGEYYISNPADIKEERLKMWVLNSFAVHFLLQERKRLASRILFEEIPSGHRFLTVILQAMLDNQQLEMTYQGFDRACAHTFHVEPYCLKVFRQRWYLVGQSDIHEELRIYSLDRVQDLNETDRKFKMPKHFDGKAYFSDYFGTVRNVNVPVENVTIRTDAVTAPYLRTLPLHATQKETKEGEMFLFDYHVAPTYDFVQELRQHGSHVEVLAPSWLRQQFYEEACQISRLYEKI